MPLLELPTCLLKDVLLKPVLSQETVVKLDARIAYAMRWLCLAQDATPDGGVALKFSLLKGWANSYPETTGYIIPTFLDYYSVTGEEIFLDRALNMVHWLLEIQNPDGSFSGGEVGSDFNGFVFDTGQILFGLLAAYQVTEDDIYLERAINTGAWLVAVQDGDGAWKNFAYHSIPHSYYSRVAWALAELWKITRDKVFLQAATKKIDWVVNQQEKNGWFNSAGFTEATHSSPYTHTIAYVIRGVLETGICIGADHYIESALLAADSLVNAIVRDKACYGTYNSNWTPTSRYSCLTGDAQVAIILFRLYEVFQEENYFSIASKLNRFLCQTQNVNQFAPKAIRGGIAGSFPVWGKYMKLSYPNWATKFFVDSLLTEKRMMSKKGKFS